MSDSDGTVRRYERTGVGDEFPDEDDMTAQPGLSGGEFPGADAEVGEMSEDLPPAGQDTTFGGRLGDYGPEGTMGTVDEGNDVSP